MSQSIDVTCPSCGHAWAEDYEEAQSKRQIYRGSVEHYAFKCPNCQDKVAVDVEVEDNDG